MAAVACLGQAGWIHAKAWLAQVLIDRAFTVAAAQDDCSQSPPGDCPQRVGSPWPWADTRPIARISLPGAARPLVVLAGSSGRNLAFGPVHDPASVLPGEPGNSIIAAHRDTHFQGLAEVAVGDHIEVERTDGHRVTFRVTALEIIDSRRARLALDANEALLTLVTCYPFDAIDPHGPLRFVVTAIQVQPAPT